MITIPTWLPILGASIVGSDVKVYWYLSRASGLTGFVLLWVSMVSGLIITNKMARIWPGAFTAFDLHQFTSLLGLGFGVFHVLVLLGNRYVPYDLGALLVPFASSAYRPVWVGLGQIAFYLLLLVTFTFYVRRQIGNRLWHWIHYVSYVVFAMILAHGLLSGTDSGNTWVFWMYWLSGASLAALTIHRLSAKQVSPAKT
jgi:predicted ferric reductase